MEPSARWVGCRDRIGSSRQAAQRGAAGPGVDDGIVHYAGAHGDEVDVAHAAQEVVGAVARHGCSIGLPWLPGMEPLRGNRQRMLPGDVGVNLPPF